VVLRGGADALTPGGSTVDILVPADQLKHAREILLADAVDDAFGSMELGDLDVTSDAGALAGWAVEAGLGGSTLSAAAHLAGPAERSAQAEEVAEMWAEHRAHRQKNVLQILALVMVALLLLASLGGLVVIVVNAV
ncbi:MAG TPA: hypothetical protein VGP46_04895, partial [Acidimicrobiales bacterium]|nr:hypothetical protein [Acidimicrobiales bacterium]